MDTLHELSFHPSNTLEHQEFEGVVHDFVAREADKPAGETTSVFASYDAASRSWRLRFETQAALEAFRDTWRDRAAAQWSDSDSAASVPLGLLANPRFCA